jgi:uncharacterized membrane protein YtjA (UPF0391 family)
MTYVPQARRFDTALFQKKDEPKTTGANILSFDLAKPWHGDCSSVPRKVLSRKEVNTMLSWAVTFLVVGLIAALLGFSGIAGAATQIAWILFVVFLVLALVALIMGRGRGTAL